MDDSKTVWCGNLSNQTTEELLYELFLQVGPIERVIIPTDKDGRTSNFGFVTFKHEESVWYAVKLLENTRLFGQDIRIKPRNVNNMNRSIEKSITRNNYQISSPEMKTNDLLKMPFALSPNHNFKDGRHGKWDNSYRDREDRQRNLQSYRNHDHRNNRQNNSPDRRRNNYNRRGRNDFNERNWRNNRNRY